MKQKEYFLSLQDVPASWCHQVWQKAAQFDQQLKSKTWPLKVWTTPPPTVALLFCEPSTRTMQSFSIAAQRLGLPVIRLDGDSCAQAKGESLEDTVLNLEAMGVSIFVIRHQKEGVPARIANMVGPKTTVINAGDGQDQHPSQALLDGMTL